MRLTFKKAESQFLSAVNAEKFEDVRFQIKTSGGSKGKIRFWVRVDRHGLERRTEIIEFKELGEPATCYYQDQINVAARFKEISELYRPENDDEFKLVSTKHDHFLRRPRFRYSKKIDELIEENPKDKKISSYTLFVAQSLGQMHGRQVAGKNLLAQLKKGKGRNAALIEKLVSEYLTELKKI